MGIIGKPRTGKTIMLTAIGYNDYLNGRKIFSNYWLNFPHTRYTIEDILSIQYMEMEISPKTVLMQEASKWFDSRRSGRDENVLLTSFTGQSGKREIDVYYDDQFITRIDKGLRDVTEMTLMSNCKYDTSVYPKIPIYFEYEVFGGYFVYPMGRTLRFDASGMSDYYDMYMTREPTRALQTI